MPMNRALYPPNWADISLATRKAAGWTCQTCGRPCRPKGLSVADFAGQLPEEWRSQLFDGEKMKPQRFTLTVAHIDPDPQNCAPDNLVAECAPCHLRRDSKMHRNNAAQTRARKLQPPGQLALQFLEQPELTVGDVLAMRARGDRPYPMRILSYGWTAGYLPPKGPKTVTRRDWAEVTVKAWQKAWDQGRKFHRAVNKQLCFGGRDIGIIELTERPYLERLEEMPIEDVWAEGGMCQTVPEFLDKYFEGKGAKKVAVVRFRFYPLPTMGWTWSPSMRGLVRRLSHPAAAATLPNTHRAALPSLR